MSTAILLADQDMHDLTQLALEQSGTVRNVAWHDSLNLLAFDHVATWSGQSRTTLLQTNRAKVSAGCCILAYLPTANSHALVDLQHSSLAIQSAGHPEDKLPCIWSPNGYPAALLTPSTAGKLHVWSPVGGQVQSASENTSAWMGQTIAKLGMPLGKHSAHELRACETFVRLNGRMYCPDICYHIARHLLTKQNDQQPSLLCKCMFALQPSEI